MMPTELVERRAEAARFGTGFETVEHLGATLLDWAWHRVPAPEALADADAEAFGEEALCKAGLAIDAIPPRYRTGYFASEVLDADTVEWFDEGDGTIRARRARLSVANCFPAVARSTPSRPSNPSAPPKSNRCWPGGVR